MYKKYFKRLLDLFFCIIGLPVFFLLMLLITPIILITDKGSVFYNANRLGKNGKLFKMYKFRTMYMNAPDIRNEDGSTYNSENDPRVTPIGRFLRKTSIDEFPQFLNILRNEMSLVGPRPGLPLEDDIMPDDEKKRRSIAPGITGYSQALFRNSDSVEERMKNDIYYVNNVSLFLDIKIIIKTIASVIKRKNINRNDVKR